MSQRPPEICRAYARSKRCRFGDKCKFIHQSPSSSQTASGSQTPQARAPAASGSTPRSSPAPSLPGVARGGAPPNVCQFFWESGACSRSFDCRMRHEKKPAEASTPNASDQGRPQNSDTQEGGEEVEDFFSGKGFLNNNGFVQEERNNLNPSEVHNHIKVYLRKNYYFEKSAYIQGFVKILASVNDQNKAWNSSDAQAFLDMLVNGDGLLRIGEVLRRENVGFMIGRGSDTLSFQKGYFPILQFFTSDLILKSTIHKNINHLYTVIENNYDTVHSVVMRCVGGMVDGKSWKDPTPSLPPMLQNTLNGVVVFRVLSTILFQFATRFKDALRNHPTLLNLVNDVETWFNRWAGDVVAVPPLFQDIHWQVEPKIRELTIKQLRDEVARLVSMVRRESDRLTQRTRKDTVKQKLTPAQKKKAMAARLTQAYDPPGELRDEGARHDNDFADIRDIRVAPTRTELLCPLSPYLPPFISDAPHHLPLGSMERHLDIQFRLLREELIAPIRSAIGVIHQDVITMKTKRHLREPTKLEKIIEKKGGAYKTSGIDSLFFQVYTGVRFSPVKAERRDLTVGLEIDAPTVGGARDATPKKRSEYWEHSKRLQSDHLVALVLVDTRRELRIFLGVITSLSKDIAESAKASEDRVQVRLSFFDPEVELMALRREHLSVEKGSFAILVDNSVMFESARPFLERLQTLEPTSIPFAQYITHLDSLAEVPVEVPRYTLRPRFKFDLQCLAKKGQQIHSLDIHQPNSVALARVELMRYSELDPSQVDALLNTLGREVALNQGPPGTGKSWLGKNTFRVLLNSGIKPILLMAFTNHALDHMVSSILEDDITQNVVRIGSRSSNERVLEYTLDKLERAAGASSLDRSQHRQYKVMKDLEESIIRVMESIQLPAISWEQIQTFLEIQYPEHADALAGPPFWILKLFETNVADEKEHGAWQTAPGSSKKKSKREFADDKLTIYRFWREGMDLRFIQPTVDNLYPPEVVSFFSSLGFGPIVPPFPSTSRDLGKLLDGDNVNPWGMSAREREILSGYWEEGIRSQAYAANLNQYNNLRDSYKGACAAYNEIRDENRRRLLSQSDLIACTTTGAAKLTSLLTNICPRVLIVEEAGQVLEAHILASLVDSVQHLICIGDPEQLRPNIANFSLSVESSNGNMLYKFDRSLMERLSELRLPMSQLNVQRRMRPTISHFIRTILYPKLEDNEIVKSYPAVSGMQQNVAFFNHRNKEGGTEDSVSKFNTFEVQMICDLVFYLTKQGIYNESGDIAVLCAYLGQLQKVRAALKNMKISVAIDERDAQELAKQGLDEDAEFKEVLVTQHIRLGTVDIFQGQEAKVVIVSLVRNTGTFETEKASIGFLKSSNRINVALSRAKHGLYVFGNAANLRKNGTWSTILDEMEKRDQVVDSLSLICPRHPDQKRAVTKPGEMGRLCPGGGCLLPCATQMPCGHICPSSCHFDFDNHRSMTCDMPCTKIPCSRKHPCPKRCSQDCGDCEFPMSRVRLPCGHIKKKVPCHLMEHLNQVECAEEVIRRLPHCEHSAKMKCSDDPEKVWCKMPCGGTMQCCSKTCKSQCSSCQKASVDIENPQGRIQRTQHTSHPCERSLYCQHLCGLACSQDHHCNSACKGPCRQQCAHHKCPKPCSAPCVPCMEACQWNCPHHTCPVACGSICSRLPCDEPCPYILKCGHQCPSVCGEPCDQQRCVECLPDDERTNIVDFIMQRRLSEVDLTSDDISERLITLPCGHIFTVETLDGHCNMHDFYEVDGYGQFLGTKAPPIEYQNPPTCPLCKGPITALRYGRVLKRATLDILERNVASDMSKSLDNVSTEFQAQESQLAAMQESAKKLISVTNDIRETTATLPNDADPLSADLLSANGMQIAHGLSEPEAEGWCTIVGGLLRLYGKVVRIASTKGAHVRAYEAALSTLYRLELQALIDDPARISDTPENAAMEQVNKKIGQPPHKADTRFQIEAFFTSLEIRYIIAEVGASRLDALPSSPEKADEVNHRNRWRLFLTFLYDSCIRDAQKALAMAEKSCAARQAARATVQVIRVKFEKFRFEVVQLRNKLEGDKATKEERIGLAELVEEWGTVMKTEITAAQRTYLQGRASKDTKQLAKERNWFANNCSKRVNEWSKNCEELAVSIREGGVYKPLSTQEREDIIKAFDFRHAGHFYNCENGHPFVITECGGAMQEARCPECDAPIGGGSHTLLGSNTRAREFEEIQLRMGAEDNPWAPRR